MHSMIFFYVHPLYKVYVPKKHFKKILKTCLLGTDTHIEGNLYMECITINAYNVMCALF